MANVTELTSANFESEVLKASGPAVVDFSADWCAPCRQLSPIIEKLAGEYAGKVTIGAVDVDQARDLAQRFNIMSVPTVMFFKGGEAVDQVLGLVPESALRQKIDALLG